MESRQRNTVIVSSCLLGLDTRYDGVCKKDDAVIAYLQRGNWIAIPVCPEQLGGLPTPRPASQFSRGDGDAVLDGSGRVTDCWDNEMNGPFLKGAEQTLEIARFNGCSQAIMKERSPSCGVREIYRGGRIVSGRGVASALLVRNGLTVVSEDRLDEIVDAPTCKKD